MLSSCLSLQVSIAIDDGVSLIEDLLGCAGLADDLYFFVEAWGYGMWCLRRTGLLMANPGRKEAFIGTDSFFGSTLETILDNQIDGCQPTPISA